MNGKEKNAGVCRGCQKPVDGANAFYCPNCFERVCPDCAKKNGGICRRCLSPLERFS